MAEPLAKITPVTDLGMVLIRADLASSGDALVEAVGLPVPDVLRFTSDGTRDLFWFSPDELLLTLPLDQLDQAVQDAEQALMGAHGLVLDVSDMRCVYDVIGPYADDVLMKLTPADVAAMGADHIRRSRLAQVAAGFWRINGGWRVIAFRSVADYVATILKNAATPGTQLAPRLS
ncbi:MAG: sarcosine oxidase subunit gamma family protein [Paracoccus sp. (in: a-proteobacteria)]|uniref:sarcosine oxidase subunit gamma n=1 Tax=Paracoccus sp. TaxID=267 RepID=UPI0026DF6E61|nr:sarcosine oxidase subunit gamma family protein [Paracoccus sp. (in: a-proteobacteria)]MDO5620475.1 sarcosine oxidase subunit gamma family protein [Paracoccus sp. (in: a-proteobacteria)]